MLKRINGLFDKINVPDTPTLECRVEYNVQCSVSQSLHYLCTLRVGVVEITKASRSYL